MTCHFIHQILTRGVPFTGHSAGSQGYSSSTRRGRFPFTGFRFCWRKKTENKHANLFCELVIVVHSLCLFSRLYFSFPRYFSPLWRSYWQKAKLVLNSGLELVFNSLQIIFSLLWRCRATIAWLL